MSIVRESPTPRRAVPRLNGLAALAVLALVGGPARAADPVLPVQEVWESAFINGHKAGYVHLVVQAIDRDGETIYRATKELRLTLLRDGQRAEVKADIGTDETADGTVVGVFMRQWLGKQQTLVLNGVVDGNKLSVKVKGQGDNEKAIRWNPKVVGLRREQTLLREKKARTGDSFDYLYYEPTVNAVVTIRITVGDVEEVSLPGGKQKKLLRIDARPDKIQNVQLPGSSMWCDPTTYQPLKTRVEMPGLGTLTLIRGTRPEAVAPPGKLVDLISTQSIRLGGRVPGLHDAAAAVYRITLKDEDPTTAFARDARQEVRNAEGQTFELVVKAIRAPRAVENARKPGAEFLESNYFINSDDAGVKKLAKEAVGDAADPWLKARRIERWVRQHMKDVDYTEAMATADRVARTLRGDCTEFAMLTAAMCRAEGVPSRTAIGLVYTEDRRGGLLAFHMWTEVWVKGQWLALDATMGKGSVGPGHLKITDHSWHETRSFAPLLPVTRVILAKPAIEVEGVRRGE